jgi:hypothetical protein
MSLLGNIFGKEKKSVKRHPRKEKKKNTSNKKIPHGMSDKKKEEKVKEQVFNSDREVENYYKQERERAKDFLKQVEKGKAASLLEVARKQYNQTKNERDNIDLLINDLVDHAKNITLKTRELNQDKEHNKKNVEFVKKLKNSFLKLEKEASGMINVRKELTNKEKSLVDRMNKLAEESIGKLRLSDKENAERLLEIESSKVRLVNEAKTLLLQENYEMLLDEKVLDKIGNIARTKIKILNKKLKDIRKERIDLLKKKQLLEISEEKAKERLIDAEKRIDRLKRKYHRVLG